MCMYGFVGAEFDVSEDCPKEVDEINAEISKIIGFEATMRRLKFTFSCVKLM